MCYHTVGTRRHRAIAATSSRGGKISPKKRKIFRLFFFGTKKKAKGMWILFAFGSALFAGLTSILAKCGIKRTDSTVATAIRTGVVLVMSCLMVLIVGSFSEIGNISVGTWCFLVLSGLATGASWLSYFRALQLGSVDKVVPIDKSSTVLSILLAFLLLGEPISPLGAIAVPMIAVGTYLMIEKRGEPQEEGAGGGKLWLLYAVLSAVFAALTSILGKVGISGVESNLGTMLRTAVVLVMAWLTVFVTGKRKDVRGISKKELLFIVLSGVATGASWLCYYKALKDGPASVVVPIDKLSLPVTLVFSYFVFGEKLSRRALGGLILIVAGTLLLLVNV